MKQSINFSYIATSAVILKLVNYINHISVKTMLNSIAVGKNSFTYVSELKKFSTEER